MNVTGSATLHAPREKVWAALNDPSVLARTIPGCQQLVEVSPDTYRMTLRAGVASIKGTYAGDVALADRREPDTFTLRAAGAGAPGTVSADVRVRLTEVADGSTRLDYDADAVVGGMIGGVGQRVLAGVAKKTAGEFFAAVDAVLSDAVRTDAVRPVPAPRAEPAAVAARAPAVFAAAGSATPAHGGRDFVKGAVFGAAVALLGAVVGALAARRRG